jgi:hypothetical protein
MIDKMETTRETIIGEIRRVARELGSNQLSLSEFRSESEISTWHIWRLFDSWNEAVSGASLIPHTEKEKIAEDDLFIEMERVFSSFGGICSHTKFARLAKYSTDVYKKRFDRWNSILSTFRNWLEENNIVTQVVS